MRKTLLTLLTTLLCSITAWGETYSIVAPENNVNTYDGITIAGTKDSVNFTSAGKRKCFNTNSKSSVYIYSKLTNITGISFDIVRNSNGSSKSSAVTITTATGGVFSTPSSGFSATNDGGDLASLSGITAIGNNQANPTSISVSFTSPVKSICILQTNSSAIRNITVTYDSGTLPTTYFAAHISGENAGTIDTNPGGASTTVTTTSDKVSIGGNNFYKLNSGGVTIDLGTGHSFAVGDQIAIEIAGASNNQDNGLKIQTGDGTDKCTISTGKVTNVFPIQYYYIVSSSDGIAGQQTAKFVSTSTYARFYGYSVLRTSSCTSITPTFTTDYESTTLTVGGSNSSTPVVDKDGSSGTITWESSNEYVATVNSSGVVTPVASGSATITATIAANGDYCEGTVSKDFTVTCPTPDAPDGVTAGSITSSGATLTISDDAGAASYDIYYSTSSSAPGAGTAASTTSASKTKTLTGLTASTSYYVWVRSVCDATHKSDWVALTSSTFTTLCVAPTSPSISGTTEYTAGQDIELTADATGISASATYTWYKGEEWDDASETTPVQAASTSGATFTKASSVEGDAGTYWCEISNGTGCNAHASKTITVGPACTDPELTITLN